MSFNPTPEQIRGYILIKGYKTIEAFAISIQERRDTVSQVINYLRVNERVRRKIERKLGITFDRAPSHRHAA